MPATTPHPGARPATPSWSSRPASRTGQASPWTARASGPRSAPAATGKRHPPSTPPSSSATLTPQTAAPDWRPGTRGRSTPPTTPAGSAPRSPPRESGTSSAPPWNTSPSTGSASRPAATDAPSRHPPQRTLKCSRSTRPASPSTSHPAPNCPSLGASGRCATSTGYCTSATNRATGPSSARRSPPRPPDLCPVLRLDGPAQHGSLTARLLPRQQPSGKEQQRQGRHSHERTAGLERDGGDEHGEHQVRGPLRGYRVSQRPQHPTQDPDRQGQRDERSGQSTTEPQVQNRGVRDGTVRGHESVQAVPKGVQHHSSGGLGQHLEPARTERRPRQRVARAEKPIQREELQTDVRGDP